MKVYVSIFMLLLCVFVLPAEKMSEARARGYLNQNGIEVNKEPPATTLEGIHDFVLCEVVFLKISCNCTVVVTGGTENTGGHKQGTHSHQNGYKVDLRLGSEVTKYIKSVSTDSGKRSDDAPLWTWGNAVYALESNHWDVVKEDWGSLSPKSCNLPLPTSAEESTESTE